MFVVVQTRLVLDGGKQPFKPEDSVMIYREVNDVKSVYFAEILDITGYTIRYFSILWLCDNANVSIETSLVGSVRVKLK